MKFDNSRTRQCHPAKRLVTVWKMTTILFVAAAFGSIVLSQTGTSSQPDTWHIKSNVKHEAKTDSNLERTKLGLSEEVELSIRPASTPNAGQATWKVTQGHGFCDPDQGVNITYRAHHTAESATVEAKIGQETKTISFTVVKPTGVKGINPPAKHFAGSPVRTTTQSKTLLSLDLEIQPTDVSFYNVLFAEKVGTKSGTGDFSNQGWAPIPTHDPSEMSAWPANNTNTDTVGANYMLTNFPRKVEGQTIDQWPTGSFTWHIPWKYQAQGGEEVEDEFTYDQLFEFAPQSNGTMILTVTKFVEKLSGNNR